MPEEHPSRFFFEKIRISLFLSDLEWNKKYLCPAVGPEVSRTLLPEGGGRSACEITAVVLLGPRENRFDVLFWVTKSSM